MWMSYFVFVRNSESAEQSVLPLKTIKAVASPVRLVILFLLKDPAANFPPQTHGDLARDGVCADFIRDKLEIAAATVRGSERTNAGDTTSTRAELADRTSPPTCRG